MSRETTEKPENKKECLCPVFVSNMNLRANRMICFKCIYAFASNLEIGKLIKIQLSNKNKTKAEVIKFWWDKEKISASRKAFPLGRAS